VISGEIRAGRELAVKQKMLAEFWGRKGSDAGHLVDVPAGQVMKFGAVLPEPGEEAPWIAIHAAPR
jgi:hypothetical protein